jgi:signal transduction histidine kinase
VVIVRDTGCGIPVEHLETIYEPFFTTKGEKGTGIGLWVVKGIVERLGGRILVETSTTGQTGTCFRITLPSPKGETTVSREYGERLGKPLAACHEQLAILSSCSY